MRIESAGHIRAISRVGAMGLMQLMADKWAALRIHHRLGNDPCDPRDNIFAGAAHLREMHDRYGSPGFLAAYNAGSGRYDEYLAGGRALPAESRTYVAAIAPLIGNGEIADPAPVAAAHPLSWTRASLCIGSVESTAAAVPAQSRSRSGHAPAASSLQALSVITEQSSGLFTARSDAGAP